MDELHQEDPVEDMETSSPRKRSRGVSPDTKQRRERGRAAQAAFRKRQIDTIQQQQEQLAAFGDAFKMINIACSKLKLAVKMSAAIGSGEVPPHIANEILDQLEQAMDQAPKTMSVATKPSTKTSVTASVSPLAQSEPAPQIPAAVSSSPSLALTTHNRPENTTTSSDHSLITEADRYAAIFMSPADPQATSDSLPGIKSVPQPMTMHIPPIELIPYMSHAQHTSRTFAGRLFWSTMAFGYRLVSSMDWDSPGVDKMFQYYKQHFNQDMVKRRIATKLVTNGTGVIQGDLMPEITAYLNRLVVKTMAESGEQLQNYLDPREVELYFRRRWIDPNNLSLVDTSDVFSALSTDELTKMLLKELTVTAVCFGDTPRYHVDDVEKVYQAVAARVQTLPNDMAFSTTGALDYVPAC